MNVLFVEGHVPDAELASRALADFAPEVTLDWVLDVRQALERLGVVGVSRYHLALVAARLPDGEGVEVLAAIRRQNLPLAVVIVTDIDNREAAITALKAGADDYVIKRQGWQARLLQTLESAFQRFKAEKEQCGHDLSVLYGESSETELEQAIRFFQRSAPHVHLETMSSGDEVLDRLASPPPPDALLLDDYLPGMNTLDLLKELRQVRQIDLPVIVMARPGDEGTASLSIQMGAFDWIIKHPGYLLKLPSVLEKACSNAALVKKQAALQASEERYRSLFEASPDAIFVADLEGNIQFCNERAAELTGYLTASELSGMSVLQLIDAEEHTRARRVLRATLLKGSVGPVEYNLLRKDGTRCPIEMNASLIRDAAGKPVAFTAVTRDITKRQQMEDELRASNHHHRIFSEMTSDYVYVMSVQEDGSVVLDWVSDAFERITGYRVEEFKEKGPLLIAYPDDLPIYRQNIEKLLAGEPVESEVRSITKGGEMIWLRNFSRPIWDAENKHVKWIYGAAQDITESKQVQVRVEHQVQRLEALRTIGMAINASIDLRVTLTILLEHVTAQLGVDAAAVRLFNPSSQNIEFGAGRGFRRQSTLRLPLRVNQGLAGLVLTEHRLVCKQHLFAHYANRVPAADPELPQLQAEGFLFYCGAPLVVKGQVKGVLEVFHRSPFSPVQEWFDFLEMLADQATIAINNAELFEDLQRTNLELTLAYDTTLEGWVRALDLRDQETEGHTLRVADKTLELARRMGLADEELIHIRRGALLHDIGKMGIPDSILLKPGPLTEEEWQVMRQHPLWAYQLLSPIPYLDQAIDIPYCHHERWDGTGYPRGLKGEEIPLGARIFTVVDVWDALRSDRPYRSAWSEAEVRSYLQSQSAIQFDPQVLNAFLSMED